MELLKYDHKIVIIDNLINSKEETVDRLRRITGKNVVFYQADLLEEKKIEEIFKKHSFDSVMHFAGLKLSLIHIFAEFKKLYSQMTEKQDTQIENVVIRLETEANIYTVLDYFGVASANFN